MRRSMDRRCLTLVAAGCAMIAGGGLADTVDMAIAPDQAACVNEIIEVDVILSTDDPVPQPFDAVDALIKWDPAELQLLCTTQANQGAPFFITGFLNDPDDINDDTTDGDALFTAFVAPGQTANAPLAPATLVVTTVRFRVLDDGVSTANVELLPMMGLFGKSRVLLGGGNITDVIAGPTDVDVQGCLGDIDCNDTVDTEDVLALINGWGPCPPPPAGCPPEAADCPADLAAPFGVVDTDDLLQLINAWGDCPPTP